MDTTSLLVVIVAAVYGMLSLMSLVLLARRVSMLDYCLRELEKKLPILIPSDLKPLTTAQVDKPAEVPAPVEAVAATIVVRPSGLTAPIGSIELSKPEPKAKSKKAPKGKSAIKKGKK